MTRSIQGEQQQEREAPVFAEPGDVDNYVDNASENILVCRERGRHLFPPLRAAKRVFTGYDQETGRLKREVVCTCCECAVRVELWEPYRVGKHTRYRPVVAYTTYRLGPGGVRYGNAPGMGRMTVKMIRESLVEQAIGSVSPRDVLRDAIAAEKEG